MRNSLHVVFLACAASALPQLLPAQSDSDKDIVQTAVAAGKFKTLATALKAADLVDALRGKGPFTVFAPTDAAFAKLPKGTVATLLKPENKAQLQAILKLHVVSGRVDSTTALKLGKAPTLQGETLGIRLENGRLKVGTANVIANDVAASNGVIHIIDSVLLPTPATTTGAASLIEFAIETGAPLYNKGQREACAAIYELCVRSLVALPSKDVPSRTRAALKKALTNLQGKKDPMDRAWALRSVLDSTWDAIDDAKKKRASSKSARVTRHSR